MSARIVVNSVASRGERGNRSRGFSPFHGLDLLSSPIRRCAEFEVFASSSQISPLKRIFGPSCPSPPCRRGVADLHRHRGTIILLLARFMPLGFSPRNASDRAPTADAVPKDSERKRAALSRLWTDQRSSTSSSMMSTPGALRGVIRGPPGRVLSNGGRRVECPTHDVVSMRAAHSHV